MKRKPPHLPFGLRLPHHQCRGAGAVAVAGVPALSFASAGTTERSETDQTSQATQERQDLENALSMTRQKPMRSTATAAKAKADLRAAQRAAAARAAAAGAAAAVRAKHRAEAAMKRTAVRSTPAQDLAAETTRGARDDGRERLRRR